MDRVELDRVRRLNRERRQNSWNVGKGNRGEAQTKKVPDLLAEVQRNLHAQGQSVIGSTVDPLSPANRRRADQAIARGK